MHLPNFSGPSRSLKGEYSFTHMAAIYFFHKVSVLFSVLAIFSVNLLKI